MLNDYSAAFARCFVFFVAIEQGDHKFKGMLPITTAGYFPPCDAVKRLVIDNMPSEVKPGHVTITGWNELPQGDFLSFSGDEVLKITEGFG